MLCATATGLSGSQAKAKLFQPLSLSLLTTCIGYAVMAFSPMPGLRQMAVFCITGLFAAYVNVLFVASHYMSAAQPTRTATAFARGFARLPRINGTNKTIFIAALLIASTVGILQLKTQMNLHCSIASRPS